MSQADPPKAPIRQLSLLDTVIIILTSCSIVIFVFTIGAKFLGRDTFDKLPDFLKDSYSALWSAGVIAGGALAASVVDALSRRESTKASFFTYITVMTLIIMALIVGTVELSRAIEGPQFNAPPGATVLDLKTTMARPADFYLQDRLGGAPARIRGSYQVKDGRLEAAITEAELEPVTFPPFPPPGLRLTSFSVHVCYLTVRNGFPLATQRPEFPTASNRETISAISDMHAPYQIPPFKVTIDIAGIDNIAPAYLCAFVDGDNNAHLTYY